MSSTASATTLAGTLSFGPLGRGGYRRLVAGPGEPYRVRRELGGAPDGSLQPLCSFLQLSDIHVTDAQSPARAEFLDRYGDADSRYAQMVGRVGVYRAQECLSVPVAEAMVRAAQQVERGPFLNSPIDFALSTGDATDNSQRNELDCYLALLCGGMARGDSGDPGRFEGVGALDFYDSRYWHPDGTPAGESDDLPRARRGFPLVPGLLDAARAPITTSGLATPWYAVYGNHDCHFAGTLPSAALVEGIATGGVKCLGLAEGIDPLGLLVGNEDGPAFEQWGAVSGPFAQVTADAARRPVTSAEWVRAHLDASGEPRGHGFSEVAGGSGATSYAFDAGPLRFIVLDTVNHAGGWQGALDRAQFDWLEEELIKGHREFLSRDGQRISRTGEERLFVLVSHHPLETLINGFAPDGVERVLGEELLGLLGRFGNVVCWVNGHTHENAVRPIIPPGATHGLWQVTTASHIDWPQQSRVIELALSPDGDELVIACSMLDHLGVLDPRRAELDDPLALAGWSRELSANAWQGRRNGAPIGAGTIADRNVVLTRSLGRRWP